MNFKLFGGKMQAYLNAFLFIPRYSLVLESFNKTALSPHAVLAFLL